MSFELQLACLQNGQHCPCYTGKQRNVADVKDSWHCPTFSHLSLSLSFSFPRMYIVSLSSSVNSMDYSDQWVLVDVLFEACLGI